MTVVQAGAIGGPLLGGVLIPVTGYAWLYLLDTLSLLATLWRSWRCRRFPSTAPRGRPGRQGSARSSTGCGICGVTRSCSRASSSTSSPWSSVCRVPLPRLAHVEFGGPAGGGMFALLFAAIPARRWSAGVLGLGQPRPSPGCCGARLDRCVGRRSPASGSRRARRRWRRAVARGGAGAARRRRRGRHGVGGLPDDEMLQAAADEVRAGSRGSSSSWSPAGRGSPMFSTDGRGSRWAPPGYHGGRAARHRRDGRVRPAIPAFTRYRT